MKVPQSSRIVATRRSIHSLLLLLALLTSFAKNSYQLFFCSSPVSRTKKIPSGFLHSVFFLRGSAFEHARATCTVLNFRLFLLLCYEKQSPPRESGAHTPTEVLQARLLEEGRGYIRHRRNSRLQPSILFRNR